MIAVSVRYRMFRTSAHAQQVTASDCALKLIEGPVVLSYAWCSAPLLALTLVTICQIDAAHAVLTQLVVLSRSDAVSHALPKPTVFQIPIASDGCCLQHEVYATPESCQRTIIVQGDNHRDSVRNHNKQVAQAGCIVVGSNSVT